MNKKRIWDFLGSRDLSVFVFVMACTYSLILIIFAIVIPLPWVNRIAALLPFKILYLLFFVNLIICEIKWIPAIIWRCRRSRPPKTAEELARFTRKITVSREPLAVSRLERYLGRRGYQIQGSVVRDQGSENPSLLLYASRGRFSPLGNLLFHAAFIFLLIGGWKGIYSGFDGSVILMEGQDFMGAEYDTATSLAGPPNVSFRVEKITPQYWKDNLLFTDLKADVKYPYRGEIRSGVVRLAQPLRVDGVRVTMNGVGFVPIYILKDKNGMELNSSYVQINIFPPGTEDHFEIPGFPHRIFISFYPDHEMKEGKIINHSMNPVNPAYYVKVFRNKVPSYSGVLKPGQEAYFEGLSLSFTDIKYFGIFRVVRNPGFVYIWTAFILAGAGLVWRVLFYRREVVLIKEGETLYLYGNSDYYHALFEGRLRAALAL